MVKLPIKTNYMKSLARSEYEQFLLNNLSSIRLKMRNIGYQNSARINSVKSVSENAVVSTVSSFTTM